MSDEDTEVDYQLGTHEIDTSGSIVDDDNVVEFDFEPEAVFRRLADDIYTSPEAGIREPLTNAITSVRRAFSDQSETGQIRITVQDGDQVMMRLRDTGEGISKAVLNEVLTVIGRSNAIDDGELSGQYGMGFLASYKLVGMDGGFLMCTNPRDAEEGPYSGLFKPGTFEPDKDGSLPKLLDEDEYGTVFEYYVKDDISIENLREWVEKHARWSTVPVSYRELDEDGTEQYNEDFHAPAIDWQYDAPSIKVENQYYEAATSPDAENDVVLISSPVSMRGKRALRKSLPWGVDLRLKYENGVVFEGPNEGMVPTEDAHYDNMEEERQSGYIRKSNLESDDMALPEPTGTRETLRRNRSFLRHVNSQLLEKYIDIVEETLDNFEPKSMSMQDLDDMGRHVMLRIFKQFEDEDKDYDEDDVERKLSKNYDYDNPDDELLEFILTMTQTVSIISEEKNRSKEYPKKPAYKLLEDDEKVFMCVSSNSWKATAVEESEADESIIKVGSADEYEPFEEHLGWEPLKVIKKDNATDILEIDEETLEEVSTTRSSKSEEIDEREITAHYKSGGRNTLSRKVETIKDWYDDGSTPARAGDVLLLFYRTSGPNISDHYELADNRCMVACCSKKEAEELKAGSENIIDYEDYTDWVLDKTVETSIGQLTMRDVLNSDIPVVLNPQSSNDIKNTSVLQRLAEGTKNQDSRFDEVPLWCVIESSTLTHLINIRSEIDEDNIYTIITQERVSKYLGDEQYHDEVELYANAKLSDELMDSPEFKSVLNNFDGISEDFVIHMECLYKAYSKNGELASQKESEDSFKFPNHTTREGQMSLKELYERYDESNVVLHVLPTDKIGKFESSEMLNTAHDRLTGVQVESYEIPSVGTNGIYVPVLESEYKKIKSHVDDRTVVLGTWERRRERSYNISDDAAYARAMLNNWDGEFVEEVATGSFNQVVQVVDTLKEVHDNGELNPKTLDFEDIVSAKV